MPIPRPFMERAVVAGLASSILILSLLSSQSRASDDDFEVFLDGICQAGPLPLDLFVVCNNAFPAGSLAAEGGAAAFNTSSNLGTSGAQGSVASNLDGKNRLDDDDQLLFEFDADSGGFGLLLAAQTGATERDQTDLENGYDSSLVGVTAGVDYLFSERFVLGAIFSHSEDEADFDGGAGKLDSDSDSLLLYLTWLPGDRVAVDAYLGAAQSDFDGERGETFGNIDSIIENSTSSDQTLAGFSLSYQWSFDRAALSGFLAYDRNDSEIDAYTESGNSGLELIYPEQEVESETTSLGIYLSYDVGFAWGTLVPNLRLAAVHESGDGGREILTELAISPGSTFTVETDDPDRDYGLLGLGLAGALNGGQQWFVDYETRLAHDFIDEWSLSAGYLLEF